MSENWIQTHTGRIFSLTNKNYEDIDIEDIAHALANICRFCGHSKYFYSVAQHSVLVAQKLPEHLKLVGLLHDASEAYLSDIPTPIKKMLPEYQKLENDLSLLIYEKYEVKNLYINNKDILYSVDKKALSTEKRDLMEINLQWGVISDIEPYTEKIIPLQSLESKQLFLKTFQEIKNKR